MALCTDLLLTRVAMSCWAFRMFACCIQESCPHEQSCCMQFIYRDETKEQARERHSQCCTGGKVPIPQHAALQDLAVHQLPGWSRAAAYAAASGVPTLIPDTSSASGADVHDDNRREHTHSSVHRLCKTQRQGQNWVTPAWKSSPDVCM